LHLFNFGHFLLDVQLGYNFHQFDIFANDV